MEMQIQNYSDILMKELCKKLKRAVLFVDRNTTEFFQWNGGFARMLSAGVKCVKEFSPFEKVEKGCSKVVFVISSLLTDESTRRVIKMIIDNSGGVIEYCIVVTNVNHQSHLSAASRWRETSAQLAQSTGTPIFDHFEQELLDWMGNRNFTVEVLSISLFTGVLSDDVFFALPFSDLNVKLENANFHSDFFKLNELDKSRIESLVSCFNCFFAAHNAKEEIFCVGPMSSLIGSYLGNTTSSRNRRKTNNNPISLILIDRTCDLITPSIGVEASAMDQVLYSNPPFGAQQSERIVKENKQSDLPPFTIFENCQDPEANILIQQFIEKRINESMELATKKLESLAKRNSIDLSKATKKSNVSAEKLISLLDTFEQNAVASDFDYPPVYQICCTLRAAVEDSEKLNNLTDVLSEMELIYQLPDALMKFLQFSSEKSLAFEFDILCLIILYSLCADRASVWDSNDVESFLIAKLIKGRPNDPIFAQTGAQSIVFNIFAKLKNVAKLRNVLPQQKLSTPYIVNLLERIFDPGLPTLSEVSCKTSGLTDAIKSSLSLLMNVSKSSRPNDAKTVIFFVVGGICCSEIAAVRRKLKEMNLYEKNIILGSTRLITVQDILKMITFERSDEE